MPDANFTVARTDAANTFTGVQTLTSPIITQAINAQTGTAYTLVLTDQSKLVTLTNASAIAVTIPTNASVAFPIGTAFTIVNNGTTSITIVTTSLTVYQAGTTNTGNRTVATKGVATCLKVDTNTWFVSGAGVS